MNKAITGENAFAHSSGIHQDGLLKSKEVYEVIAPEEIGVSPMENILTAHSDKHAFSYVTKKLGYNIPRAIESEIYKSFQAMADQKKEVYDNDIMDLNNLGRGKESLGKVIVQIKHEGKLYQGKAIEKDVMKASGIALINAINKIVVTTA